MKIEFFVPGQPQALKRHRTFRTKSGLTGSYDPSKEDKSDFLAMAMNNRPEKPIEGNISMGLTFVFPRPKSHYGAKGLKPSAPYYKASKPDIDNLEKFVCDALNKVFYLDDSQVVIKRSTKRYASIQNPNDAPGVTVSLLKIHESGIPF